MQPTPTGTSAAVLHTLRCIGCSTLARVAVVAELKEAEAESELIDLAAAGHATYLPGAFGGWMVTEAGKAVDAVWSAAERDAAGAREAIADAYQRFLPLNSELLDLCGAWQLRTVDGVAVVNDHSDTAYDARVIALFADFHTRAGELCTVLAAALGRFGNYYRRLDHAHAEVRRGAVSYLAEDTESYHSVWFQLHEDLLVTLGIPR